HSRIMPFSRGSWRFSTRKRLCFSKCLSDVELTNRKSLFSSVWLFRGYRESTVDRFYDHETHEIPSAGFGRPNQEDSSADDADKYGWHQRTEARVSALQTPKFARRGKISQMSNQNSCRHPPSVVVFLRTAEGAKDAEILHSSPRPRRSLRFNYKP